jgi:hypothetical protein
MPHKELVALLTKARAVLDRYMFEGDGEGIHDDVAEVCIAIDDALSGTSSDAGASTVDYKTVPLEVERSAA